MTSNLNSEDNHLSFYVSLGGVIIRTQQNFFGFQDYIVFTEFRNTVHFIYYHLSQDFFCVL